MWYTYIYVKLQRDTMVADASMRERYLYVRAVRQPKLRVSKFE